MMLNDDRGMRNAAICGRALLYTGLILLLVSRIINVGHGRDRWIKSELGVRSTTEDYLCSTGSLSFTA